MHLQRCSWHDSFGHFVAILRGSDDGDIRFGRDVVAHIALGHVSIQLANDDLQINWAIRTNHVSTGGHLFSSTSCSRKRRSREAVRVTI